MIELLFIQQQQQQQQPPRDHFPRYSSIIIGVRQVTKKPVTEATCRVTRTPVTYTNELIGNLI